MFEVISNIGTIAGALAAILRVVIGIINLIKAIQEKQNLEIASFIDPTGFVEIQVDNKSSSKIIVQRIQLVEDSSWFRFILRKLVGIDSLIELKVIPCQLYTDIPINIPSKSTLKFHSKIDADKYDIESLRKRKLQKLNVRLEIAGSRILNKTKTINKHILLPSDIIKSEGQ